MRILFWTEAFWPSIGGVEILIAQVLPRLQARGHEVAVVTCMGNLQCPEEEEHDGVMIHRFPFLRALETRDIGQIFALRKRLAGVKQSFRPDVLHVNITDPSIYFHRLTLDAWPTALVASLHAALPSSVLAPETLVGWVAQQAGWLTSPYGGILEGLCVAFPGLRERSSVLRNGLAPPPFEPASPVAEPPCLLALGRVVHEKGFDLALDAVAGLSDAFPNLRLKVAGDGPERSALEERARELGIADRVDFLGWVGPEEVFALINTASAVLVPSRERFEATPVVIMQAGMMGRPVVASRVGGVAEIVDDGRTGWLIEQDDRAALQARVAELLRDPAGAEAMGRRAREHALEAFSLENHVDACEAIYEKIASQ